MTFNEVDWDSLAYGTAMFLAGLGVGTAIQYRRVTLFIARLQEQLAHVGSYHIKVSPLYKLRVMIFGVPKKQGR